MEKHRIMGILLSGGGARRMNGANKAFLGIGGERLIDRNVRLYRELFDEVILVTNSPREYLDLDLTIVTDIVKGKGPLGGIYTGLFFCRSDHAFVAACDMPFLNGDFIRFMTEQVRGHDIVVPEMPDGLQPLHAIYSRKCLPAIRRCVDEDRLKITGFYKRYKVHRIQADDVTRFDPEGRMFLNINAPEDLVNI
ncbi:MAG: molybdenum cofactor guanylyltransferase [Deltaproteobacteria bacterium]|nr:molybdenum cofactor guanylyltransferase [Deltaproteobacteria bacterium]